MDEQQQSREQTQRLLAVLQEAREKVTRNRRWSTLPVDWMLLWLIRRYERRFREELEASEYSYIYKSSLFSRIFRKPRL